MITIRNAAIDDFAIIHHFIEVLEDTRFDKQKQLAIFIKNITNPDNIYLVAEEDGRVAGYLSCHVQTLLHHGGRVGEIQEMFVPAAKRNSGVGKMLLARLRVIASESDIVQLEVTSAQNRVEAHQFYQAAGFTLSHKKFTSVVTVTQ